MKLTDFSALTFDCYGTLIDWETGIFAALGPLLARVAPTEVPGGSPSGAGDVGAVLSRDAALEAFGRLEFAIQTAAPAMLYADVLTEVHRRLTRLWGAAPDEAESRRFGASVGDWPAFPDTVEALRYLGQHYQLVILSNVDRTGFAATNARLGIAFDAIHTAQDIGSYKPDQRNFRYLLDRLAEAGVTPDRVLHVAQSLFHDHAPANAIGLASAWIDRRHDTAGWGASSAAPSDVRYDFRFISLGELAAAHRAEIGS